MKNCKSPEPSDVSLELISVSGKIGIHMMVGLCPEISRWNRNAS